MKQVPFFLFLVVTNLLLVKASYSQNDNMDADEEYCRANIAFSNPMILGVTDKNYAHCIRSQNYAEPDKPAGKIVINGVDFLDDGRNNDLIANDGIMTSNQLFTYSKGDVILFPGQYRLSKSNLILYDSIFRHGSQVEPDKFKLSCKFVWVKCSSWPQEYQRICLRLCWPFTGNFEVTECEFTYEK